MSGQSSEEAGLLGQGRTQESRCKAGGAAGSRCGSRGLGGRIAALTATGPGGSESQLPSQPEGRVARPTGRGGQLSTPNSTTRWVPHRAK